MSQTLIWSPAQPCFLNTAGSDVLSPPPLSTQLGGVPSTDRRWPPNILFPTKPNKAEQKQGQMCTLRSLFAEKGESSFLSKYFSPAQEMTMKAINHQCCGYGKFFCFLCSVTSSGMISTTKDWCQNRAILKACYTFRVEPSQNEVPRRFEFFLLLNDSSQKLLPST